MTVPPNTSLRKALTSGLKTKVDDFTKKLLEGSSTVSETGQRRGQLERGPFHSFPRFLQPTALTRLERWG